MKKILFVANITEHIDSFHIPYMRWFREQGWIVHVYSAGDAPKSDYDKFFPAKMKRSPYRLIENYFAYKELKHIIDTEQYNIVHCHTPVGGVLGRLASKKANKKQTKVLYTGHGFHFYKGAPYINWLFYFSVEKLLARLTDCIVTINKEDFENAVRYFGSPKTEIRKIDGIGVDLSEFCRPDDYERKSLRKRYGFDGNFIMIYAAEFIARKNHKFLINAMPALLAECPDVKLVLAGRGILLDKMKKLAKNKGLSENIVFLGYRKDMPDLYKASDVLVSSSVEEGFGINIIEGMACGLPVLASRVRGHLEMVRPKENGFLFSTKDTDVFIQYAKHLYSDKQLYKRFSQQASLDAYNFSIEHSLQQMQGIYKTYM